MVVLRGVAPKGTFVALFLPYLRLYITHPPGNGAMQASTGGW